MAPTFCNRCGDAVEEGCDPCDELDELDALSDRLRLKRYDLKRNVNQFHSPITPVQSLRRCCRKRMWFVGWACWARSFARTPQTETLRKINRFHSSIIRQIPPDVMSTIFEFCLPDLMNNQLSSYTEEDLSIPLSLGAICSCWRDIAWSTPSLWSSLTVRVTSNHYWQIATGIVKEWLSRSGQLPLSIRILSPGFQSKEVSALANIINQYSNRWSNLDLFLDLNDYQNFETDIHDPILKSIRLHSDVRYEITDPKFQLTCPRLERASL